MQTFIVTIEVKYIITFEEIENSINLKRDDKDFSYLSRKHLRESHKDDGRFFDESIVGASIVDIKSYDHFYVVIAKRDEPMTFEQIMEIKKSSDMFIERIKSNGFIDAVFNWQGSSVHFRIKTDSNYTGSNKRNMSFVANSIEGKFKSYSEFYHLHDIDVDIGAFTYNEGSGIRNKIVLRKTVKGKIREASVDCVHLALYDTTLADYDGDRMWNWISNESKHVSLEIDQHFFALKSYVQALSEVGLMKIINQAFLHSDSNFGFNTQMHSQFTRALAVLDKDLVKEIAYSFIVDVLNSRDYKDAKKWLMDKKDAITNRFQLSSYTIGDDYEIEIKMR